MSEWADRAMRDAPKAYGLVVGGSLQAMSRAIAAQACHRTQTPATKALPDIVADATWRAVDAFLRSFA